MKYYILLIIALVISGCATWIPASAKQLKDGSYQLGTTGNSFASIKKMKAKLEKKAYSLCSGANFEYIKEPSITWGEQKDYSTGISASYKVMNTTIKCTAEAPDEPK